MPLSFRKASVKLRDNEICFKNKCGLQPPKPIKKVIISYKVRSEKGEDILVLGKDRDNYLTSVLYDKNMHIKKVTDNKTYRDYTEYAKYTLNSKKPFSQEGDVGKARIAYQILKDWGYKYNPKFDEFRAMRKR